MPVLLVCSDSVAVDSNGVPSCPAGWVDVPLELPNNQPLDQADFLAFATAGTIMFVVAFGVKMLLRLLLDNPYRG